MKERYSTAKKITLIGAIVNTILGVLKCAGGFIFQSHALIADGLHSFSDLLIDTVVIFASKYGSQHADPSHPYGHQRIETAATFLLAQLLVATGALIAWDSIDELWHDTHETPTRLALVVAFISVIANEVLFFVTRKIGQKIKSDLIIANAWHHRSDAASSLVVLLGILGSLVGFNVLDGVAAVIVGILIIQMGISYGWRSIKELVDTAIDEKQLEDIQKFIENIPGVKKIHQLRTRSMAGDIYVDVHVLVSPLISVSEGHFIAQMVHHDLLKAMPEVKDVTVHVDPEDDEIASPNIDLPHRQTLETAFLTTWKQHFSAIESWTIHYLEGKIFIDIFCNQPLAFSQPVADMITKDLKCSSYPIKLRFFTHQNQNMLE
jgi:cation diffusion facilitator family transporter